MKSTGKVIGIVSNLVTVETNGPVSENEICYINLDGTLLMAEVIKVTGKNASVQVFESTRGLKNGDDVIFEDKMLEATLGPGLLSSVYDGLQNNLTTMEGVFLKRGEYTDPLDHKKLWDYVPLAKPGDKVEASDWLGEVKEGWLPHKIMVPFSFKGEYTVKSVTKAGQYNIDETIAVLTDKDGEDVDVTMTQKWPVKVAIKCYREKPRPNKIMETGVRVIDTLNPIAEGGTGFIPGPFGCGKTVLQHSIAKQGDADVIVMAACGERANEVVEIFTEFPELIDPHTGRHLMDRTTIICNTSNMPVAAREASVYTAMTICEYYRAMGLKCLLLADSTSRWAQALREMSNRMEELPGADAFPVDLSAIISNFYSRAGMVVLNNGKTGAITFIGTVSPAGGNLKEPVTESTKKAARCFYGLEQNRADQKRYPAVSPIESYSKYLEYPEIQKYLAETVEADWIEKVNKAKNIIRLGKEAEEQINILGDDGVPMSYHETYWKSELLDFVFLQQDAFDAIDSLCPIKRQKYMLDLILEINDKKFEFDNFEKCRDYFKNMINILRQMNYTEFESENFNNYKEQLTKLLEENGK
ncbi:MAG: V-type ATP synthase subunit A [Bacteroidales bacterium]|jgi:V/A-type H+-transporting ATPase subunit A|nr:V-type ATP synthase subunit A [Bacteroidales bacterium]MCI1785767.1 V-type ATP synthase subunit A [Bacteroidales bacterium]